MKLRWLYNPVNISTGLQSFYIYRGTEPGNMKLIGKIEKPKDPEDVGTCIIKYTYTDRNVSTGKRYYYYVTAVSYLGEGVNSSLIAVHISLAKWLWIVSTIMLLTTAVFAALGHHKRRKVGEER